MMTALLKNIFFCLFKFVLTTDEKRNQTYSNVTLAQLNNTLLPGVSLYLYSICFGLFCSVILDGLFSSSLIGSNS